MCVPSRSPCVPVTVPVPVPARAINPSALSLCLLCTSLHAPSAARRPAVWLCAVPCALRVLHWGCPCWGGCVAAFEPRKVLKKSALIFFVPTGAMNFERIFLVSALAVTLAAFVTIIVGAVSNTASINDNISKTFSEVNATASPAHTVLPRAFTVPLTSGTPRRTCCAGCSARRLFHRLFAVRRLSCLALALATHTLRHPRPPRPRRLLNTTNTALASPSCTVSFSFHILSFHFSSSFLFFGLFSFITLSFPFRNVAHISARYRPTPHYLISTTSCLILSSLLISSHLILSSHRFITLTHHHITLSHHVTTHPQ